MSSKFGSMFDDDEDLPQAPGNDTPEKTPAQDPGLFNDEAAALIEEKARQAAEQGKRAAKASLAAAGRAAGAMKAKAEQLKSRAQATDKPRINPMVIGLVALVLVLGGVIGWLVLSKDEDSRETSQSVAPVVWAPTAGVAPVAEEVAPTPVQDPAPVPADEPVDEPTPLPTMPAMGAGGGRYVPPSQQMVEPAPQVKAPQEPVVAPPPVSQPKVEPKPAPVASVPARSTQSQARQTKRPMPKAAPIEEKQPAAKPIGQKEQQQIDQIRSLFGEQP